MESNFDKWVLLGKSCFEKFVTVGVIFSEGVFQVLEQRVVFAQIGVVVAHLLAVLLHLADLGLILVRVFRILVEECVSVAVDTKFEHGLDLGGVGVHFGRDVFGLR